MEKQNSSTTTMRVDKGLYDKYRALHYHVYGFFPVMMDTVNDTLSDMISKLEEIIRIRSGEGKWNI